MSEEVQVQGLEAVEKLLKSVADSESYVEGLQKACALVERTAKQKAPKDNGQLRNSIASKVEQIGGEAVGVVFTPLEYAPYVEFGTGLFAEDGGRTDVPWHYQDDEGNWHTTSGMKPQPFLRPALDENRSKIKQLLKGGKKK